MKSAVLSLSLGLFLGLSIIATAAPLAESKEIKVVERISPSDIVAHYHATNTTKLRSAR